MEIKSITIENFQSHVNTVIEPAPAGQLTAMTGQSDTGKTAVIRALRWLFYNIWDDSFMRHGAKFSRVTAEYEDGTKVIRGRSRSGDSNFYDIVPPDGNRVHLTRFRGSVPLEIQLITGVKPVTISDVDINVNIAEQGEPWFLARPVSALARAKVLGKLAGTEEVDMAARSTATDLLRRKLEEKKLAGEVKALETDIEGFSYLPALAKRIVELEKVVVRIKAAREHRERLTEAREKLARVKAGKAEAEAIAAHWKYVELAERSLATAEKASIGFRALSGSREKLAAARAGSKVSAGIIRRWSGLSEAQAAALKASEANIKFRQLTRLEGSLGVIHINIIDAQYVFQKWAGLVCAEGKYATAVKASNRRAVLGRRCALLEQLRKAIGESKKTVDRLAGLDDAVTMLDMAVAAGRRATMLTGLNRMLLQARNTKKRIEATLRRVEGIEEVEKLTNNLGDAALRRGKILSLAGRLRQAGAEARKSHESAVLWEQKVSELEGAYRDELLTLSRCPLCGGDIDIKKLKEVV